MDYLTIEKPCHNEIVIKKSRFIVYCFPIEKEQEANGYIKDISKEHYKATHNTYAYILGNDNPIKRFSDDGEPSGTAGKPILECISQNNLTNILVIVTRYFGGVKLGAGGLIRAYSSSASLGIDTARIIKMEYASFVDIHLDYSLLGKLEAYLNSNNILIKNIQYHEDVTISIYLSQTIKEDILESIKDITNDRANIQCIKEEYIKRNI